MNYSVCENNLKSNIFCTRGFSSSANSITLEDNNTLPIIETTPFTKIDSIEVDIKNFKDTNVLLNITNIINTTITRSAGVTGADINVEVIFRIKKVDKKKLRTISPNYIYSRPYTLPQRNNSLNEVISQPFDILFCDFIPCNCTCCITYIIEYSATLSVLALGIQNGVPSIFNLATAVNNTSINAFVTECL